MAYLLIKRNTLLVGMTTTFERLVPSAVSDKTSWSTGMSAVTHVTII